MKLSVLISFFLLFASFAVAQQLQLYPLPQYSGQNFANGRTESQGCPSDTVRLKLPFWDDFSTTKRGVADTAKWTCGSAVYINNSMGIDMPTFNVATFDGIDAMGKPYNFATPTATGLADMLTSRPIDLSERDLKNVIFSFYLQPQGNGERPDKGDSLVLQFKDDKNRWITAASYEATDDWKDFRFQAIRPEIIGNAGYNFFHKNFQFRFYVKTRLSGMYDVWNIDYVFLGKDRNPEDDFFDMAMGKNPNYFLRDYTAMPLSHFNVKRNIYDTLRGYMNNLAKQINPVQMKVIVKDGITRDTFGTAIDSSFVVPNKAKNLQLNCLLKKVKFPAQLQRKTILQVEFQLNTRDGDKLVHGFNPTVNDTLASSVMLDNYYAYDDGSAEYGISFNQRFGRIAYEFEATKSDKLTSVDVMFMPLGFNLVGETFNLHIVKRLNIGGGSNKDSTLLIQNFFLTYPDSLNQFKRLQLARPIDISAGKFYIVIEQLSDKNLTIGFDKNIDRSNKMYVNVVNKWELVSSNIKGGLMIRPIFGATLTADDDNEAIADNYTIYPNPTQDQIFIEGNEVEKATLVNVLGQTLLEKTFEFGETKSVSLAHLTNGMYLLFLQSKGKVITKKIMLAK